MSHSRAFQMSLVGYSGRGQRDEATEAFELCIIHHMP